MIVNMASVMSPRIRTLSDSMDYDDELAELHDRRQTSLDMERYKARIEYERTHTKLQMVSPSGITRRYHIICEIDEDTEDASEDGDGRPDEPQEIKEQ